MALTNRRSFIRDVTRDVSWFPSCGDKGKGNIYLKEKAVNLDQCSSTGVQVDRVELQLVRGPQSCSRDELGCEWNVLEFKFLFVGLIGVKGIDAFFSLFSRPVFFSWGLSGPPGVNCKFSGCTDL